MNVLFVCLGNICRSPMAAGIMKSIYEERGIAGAIESAGTMDWNVGSGADPRAVSVAGANGVNLKAHRARQVKADDFERFDIIFVMENVHAQTLRKVCPPAHAHKIFLLGVDEEITDPYHGSEAEFHATYKVLKSHCLKAVQEHLQF